MGAELGPSPYSPGFPPKEPTIPFDSKGSSGSLPSDSPLPPYPSSYSTFEDFPGPSYYQPAVGPFEDFPSGPIFYKPSSPSLDNFPPSSSDLTSLPGLDPPKLPFLPKHYGAPPPGLFTFLIEIPLPLEGSYLQTVHRLSHLEDRVDDLAFPILHSDADLENFGKKKMEEYAGDYAKRIDALPLENQKKIYSALGRAFHQYKWDEEDVKNGYVRSIAEQWPISIRSLCHELFIGLSSPTTLLSEAEQRRDNRELYGPYQFAYVGSLKDRNIVLIQKEYITRGGTSSVHRVMDVANGRKYAMKKPTSLHEAYQIQGLKREVEVRQKLKERNVGGVQSPPYFVTYESGNSTFYSSTFEHLYDSDLHSKIVSKSLSLHEKNAIFSQLINGFVELNDAGFLHQDIKPENILVQKKDGKIEAVLADFDRTIERGFEEDVVFPGLTSNYTPLKDKERIENEFDKGVILQRQLHEMQEKLKQHSVILKDIENYTFFTDEEKQKYIEKILATIKQIEADIVQKNEEIKKFHVKFNADNEKRDIFSLGATLVAVIFNQLPYDCIPLKDILNQSPDTIPIYPKEDLAKIEKFLNALNEYPKIQKFIKNNEMPRPYAIEINPSTQNVTMKWDWQQFDKIKPHIFKHAYRWQGAALDRLMITLTNNKSALLRFDYHYFRIDQATVFENGVKLPGTLDWHVPTAYGSWSTDAPRVIDMAVQPFTAPAVTIPSPSSADIFMTPIGATAIQEVTKVS